MDITTTLFGIAVLIMSVVVHEVSHGIAADKLGDPTPRLQGRLTLNPLPHLDVWGSFLVPVVTTLMAGFTFGWAKPVQYNPYNISHRYGDALVGAAGPASNIALVLIFSLLIRFISLPDAALQISALIVLINLVLAVFNLIPIPPLDGSKILFSLLPDKYWKIQEALERYGFLFVLLFIFALWQFVTPFIFSLFGVLTGINI